jgi:hypothetical protein
MRRSQPLRSMTGDDRTSHCESHHGAVRDVEPSPAHAGETEDPLAMGTAMPLRVPRPEEAHCHGHAHALASLVPRLEARQSVDVLVLGH